MMLSVGPFYSVPGNISNGVSALYNGDVWYLDSVTNFCYFLHGKFHMAISSLEEMS